MNAKKANVILKAIEAGVAIAGIYTTVSATLAIAILPLSIYCLIVIVKGQ
ncbi:MAG: hypothetical protein F6J93_00275 [Oscillatoria sp. SIO1A7]|nr:hypothetical protein [Oscillatoria sp. SIO1A7]